MTAILKKNSIDSRLNVFKEQFIVPFKGTLNKPYELTSVAKNPSAKRPTEDSIIKAIPNIKDYLKTGKSPVTFEGLHLVMVYCEASASERTIKDVSSFDSITLLTINPETGEAKRIATDDGIPYHALSITAREYLDESQDSINSDDWFIEDEYFTSGFDSIGAIVINGNLLINADENATNEHEFVSSGEFDDYPTLSFNCLGNLIAKKVLSPTSAEDAIRKAKLKVVDFTPEERKEASKALRTEYSNARKSSNFRFNVWAANQTPPEAGFSLIKSDPIEWHKSSTILLRNGKESYILGQDEGTYFGCVLADNPKNIAGAYESLMPASARGVKGVLRQGEWFAIPVKNQKQVPDRYSPDTLMFADSNDGDIYGIAFAIEDKDSNRHYFNSGEVVVSRHGTYARNFEICHDEHASLIGQNDIWYTFAKNTALHSFSAERVD